MRKNTGMIVWIGLGLVLGLWAAGPAWSADALVAETAATSTPVPVATPVPAPEKPAMPPAVQVQLYGYVRLDAAYDTARMFPGNYALYVKSAADNRGDDNQLNVTANQTRLGVNLSAAEFAGVKANGKVEFDFYGGGVENKSNPMLRHGYFELNAPACDLSLLAGQTWDLISPYSPETLNFIACGMAGEIGYRRPQLRLTKNIGLGGDSKLTFKVAASRTLGDALPNTYAATFKEAADPTYQGSITYSIPLFTKQPVTLGVSGLTGREIYDTTVGRSYDSYGVYALSAEVAIPLTDWFAFKGNVWKGTNLDSYLGGIGQGILTASKQTLNCQGGWASLALGPFGGTRCSLGGGIDAPQVDQLASGSRFQNSVGYANAFFNLTPALTLGGEVSYWQTLYKDSQAGTNMRYQTAVTYSF